MCGVAGVYNLPNASQVIAKMLHALQHRGSDATGVITYDGFAHYKYTAPEKVSNALTPEVLSKLVGTNGLGHNRYATTGSSKGVENIQPLSLKVGTEMFSIAHNRNFPDLTLIEEGVLRDTPFFSDTDTERFFRLILQELKTTDILKSIEKALAQMKGACSAVLMRPLELIAIRDGSGCRPLYWGQSGDGYVVASEPCALDDIGVFDSQEVPPGTLISFSDQGVITRSLPERAQHRCSFEKVYFGYPTSTLDGIQIADFRRDLGRALSKEHPTTTDYVVAAPDSSTFIGQGYAETLAESSIYDSSILMRKHDTGRTFILAGQAARKKAVEQKFSFRTDKIAGKSITVIDDSIVRGTTCSGITQSLRDRGATEVHWRIASPQIIGSCHYGIETANKGQLIATQMNDEGICQQIGADSIAFLSLELLKSVLAAHGLPTKDTCFACVNLEYWH
jgi:amidophosphoribosyltransferase